MLLPTKGNTLPVYFSTGRPDTWGGAVFTFFPQYDVIVCV